MNIGEYVAEPSVEPYTTGRFRFHNLVRLYAVDRARAADGLTALRQLGLTSPA